MVYLLMALWFILLELIRFSVYNVSTIDLWLKRSTSPDVSKNYSMQDRTIDLQN